MNSNSEINIVAQTNDFIIIDKPANTNFHDEGDIGSGIFSLVKNLLKTEELFPVHRLDKITSGLLIFAKNLAAAQQFQCLFENHQIEKYYLAISDCKPKKKQGLIKGDMEKSRRGTWKLLRTLHNPAISQFFSYSIGDGKRLFLIKPHTGKTHQIRVALNSLGSPIIGDPNYHKECTAERGYLHAFALRFKLNGKAYQFSLPPNSGKEFTRVTTQQQVEPLSSPWLLDWPHI